MPFISDEVLQVGLAQMAPVWLNREASTLKIVQFIEQAARQQCHLVVFGEALLPGYPFWVALTDGARFEDAVQKELYAHYVSQGVNLSRGDLAPVCKACQEYHIAAYVGLMERAQDRSSHSLYCSLVYINPQGVIQSVHRKLMPTYEERLVWASGDGQGLQVHSLGAFQVGGLNCWENWMPLARTALYAQGEDLHIAVWPGNLRNTEDLTRFLAKESRSFVVSVSGLLRQEDIPPDLPHAHLIQAQCPPILANGGSCVAAPNGEWLLEPVLNQEGLFVVGLHPALVRQERQNFDPTGHYARPDVLQLHLNPHRQNTLYKME
ncbi:MAG: carbon-nitrogen hydrolase family protein [Microscillaceae bacterium]